MSLKNAKAKGSKNERRSIELLEAEGYACTKSGGSLGAWDIIGISWKGFVLVQVKSNCWPSPAEREVMRQFKAPKNCRKIMHRWNDRQRLPDIREVE